MINMEEKKPFPYNKEKSYFVSVSMRKQAVKSVKRQSERVR